MKNKVRRNIKLEYIMRFVEYFSVTEAIWVLYLAYKGLSFAEIGILEGIFHITSLLSEVPSGAMADLLGRKKTIILGRICSMLSAGLMLAATQEWNFAIAFIFSAWGYNLLSGSEEALVYDSFLYLGEEKNYYKVNSRLEVIIEIAQGISTFIGGILAEQSFAYCYIGELIIVAISIVPCFMMEEPVLEERKKQERVTWKEHFVTSFRVLKDSPQVTKILLFFSLAFTFYTSVYFYSQQYFLEHGLNKVQISTIMLAAGGISCLGAIFSERFVKWLEERTKYIAAGFVGIGITGMFLGNVLVAVSCFMEMSFFNALLYPLQSASLNKLTPSGQRATIISVGSMVTSVFMILLFPAMGWIADQSNLEWTFLLTGNIEIIVLISLGILKKRMI